MLRGSGKTTFTRIVNLICWKWSFQIFMWKNGNWSLETHPQVISKSSWLCYLQVIAKFLALLYSYLNISISKSIVPDDIKGREIHHSFPMTLFQVRFFSDFRSLSNWCFNIRDVRIHWFFLFDSILIWWCW